MDFPNYSGIVAHNIERLLADRGLSRSDLLERLNRPNTDAQVEPSWTAAMVTALVHGQTGRTPETSIDRLWDVCRALDVTLFDLLLPTDAAVMEPEIAEINARIFFGFSPTADDLATLNGRSQFRRHYRYAPEIIDRVWHHVEATAEAFHRFRVASKLSEPNQTDLLRELHDAQHRQRVVWDAEVDHQRAKLEQLRSVEELTDMYSVEQAVEWFDAYIERLQDTLAGIDAESSLEPYMTEVSE